MTPADAARPPDDPADERAAQAAYLASKAALRAARDYRAFVGPADGYDLVSANQFALLLAFGLREHHVVLDVGCGSLRAGRLLIPYLRPGHYFGIEPEAWLVEAGIRHEIGMDLVRLKRPTFNHDPGFALSAFGRRFDVVLVHSVFTHATSSQIARCLAEARRVMGARAILVATVSPGAHDYDGDAWYHAARYTWGTLRELAATAGLVLRPLRWPHPNRQRWVLVVDPANRGALATADGLDAIGPVGTIPGDPAPGA